MNANEIRGLGLPKWPQMIVTGKSVTVKQAKDIIFRTDYFLVDSCEYSGGNAHEFNKNYRKKAGLEDFNIFVNQNHAYGLLQELFDKLNFVSMPNGYVHNSFASCAYIGGPYGWCHPDGRIYYSDNVGKWPSVEGIEEDWVCIAKAFPYLDIRVTVMDRESCEEESIPVFNIVIKDGKVELMPPDLSVHERIESPLSQDMANLARALIYQSPENRELGLPFEWYDESAVRVKSAINKLLSK